MSQTASVSRRETRVHRICAWCSAVLETTRTSWNGQADLKTHGVCRSCAWEVRLQSQSPSDASGSGPARVATAS